MSINKSYYNHRKSWSLLAYKNEWNVSFSCSTTEQLTHKEKYIFKIFTEYKIWTFHTKEFL